MTTQKEQRYSGLVIRNHCVKDFESKQYASEHLFGWQQVTLTPQEWMSELEKGHTIQPSPFSPNTDGTYTHTKDNWNSTHFICADADNFKGVEFNDGEDSNPTGVESWTSETGLSERYPTLKNKVYAVSQSVSSMSTEPKHRRYRLIFLFDSPIQSSQHYNSILKSLYTEFDVITPVSRQPAQPVFGNAREDGKVCLIGNVLKLSDYPIPQPATKPINVNGDKPTETLQQFLDKHNISYELSKDSSKFYVECPHKDKHTNQKQGKTDTYVHESNTKSGKWALYCSHSSCRGVATWDEFKKAHGITTEYQHHRKSSYSNEDTTPAESELTALPVNEHTIPKFPDYEGESFMGAFQHLYLAYVDTHVWSPEMLMAMGIASLSYVAGRHITVQTHENTKLEYLNSYILSVGESDLTAKSVAIREVKKHITHCFGDFAPVSNALSLEGILRALSENNESRQYLMLDESSVVFTNSRREGTKNLLAGLNEIWLCDSYTTVRASEETRIDNPFLNCWGNIPTQLIPAVFRQDDLVSGTLNRWLPFYISPKLETVRTPHAVTEFYDKWIKHLKSISVYKEPRRLVFTTDADDLRFEWYDTLRQNAIKDGFQTGESRFHTHLVKLSGLFALADNKCDDDTVQKKHVENALSVIRYLFECYVFLFRNVGGTRLGDIENRILDVLNQNHNEMTVTELGRKLQGTDSTERERVYEVLEKHGIIIRFQVKTGGRHVNKIRRVG